MATRAERKNIIWDLSGTLFRPKPYGLSAQELEKLSLVFYMWSGKKEASVVDRLALEVLNKAEEPLPEYQVIRLHTGEPVPALVCSLLAGLISSKDALAKALHALADLLKNPFVAQKQDQIQRVLEAFFNPESLSKCMHPIEISEELVARCAHYRSNRLFILSNWDAESFDIFLKTPNAQEVLNYFERKNICISADIGYIKPQPEMYEYFLSLHNLNPNTCFFIDDQEENIAAAKTFGIEGMQFKENDSHELINTLKLLHIIR